MPILKSELSPAGSKLVETMQQINYGRICNLTVRDGEPLFTAETRTQRQIKFGNDSQKRPESELHDFALKSKVTELLDYIRAMPDGTIRQLQIKGGFPFDMTIEEPAL